MGKSGPNAAHLTHFFSGWVGLGLESSSVLTQYIGEMETRFIKETEMVFGNFEGKDARSGSFTVEPL